MKLIDIDPAFGVAASTGQGKSLAIRRMLGIGRLCPSWTLPSRIGDNPLFWKVGSTGRLWICEMLPESSRKRRFGRADPVHPCRPERRREPAGQ